MNNIIFLICMKHLELPPLCGLTEEKKSKITCMSNIEGGCIYLLFLKNSSLKLKKSAIIGS